MKYPVQDVESARETLLKLYPRGSTVFTIIRHVAQSGMSRDISIVYIGTGSDGSPSVAWPSYAVAAVTGYAMSSNATNNAIRVKGCGANFAQSIVSDLAWRLYGDSDALRYQSL